MCDKPMDCNKCKRKACIHYKEIKDGKTVSYSMCRSCPKLKEKLNQKSESDDSASIFSPKNENCPVCGQTSQDFLITLSFGCDRCIETFHDLVVKEINSGEILSDTAQKTNENQAYHFGQIPKSSNFPLFSKTMESLHISLNEAVRQEQFEAAADIRDQIKNYLENK